MKLHRPLVDHVVRILLETFQPRDEGRGPTADKIIERTFKSQRQLGARDRRFVAETSYEIIRHWRRLWYLSGHDKPVLTNEELTRLVGVFFLTRAEAPLPPWPEFKSLSAERVSEREKNLEALPAIRESVPDWLYERGALELKEAWPSALSELNKIAPVFLRANRLKTSRTDLANQLRAEGIETDLAPDTEDGLVLRERRNVFSTKSFQAGLFEIQDGASQQIAPLVGAKPGERIVDACAGAGGKTLHLAAQMKNKGKIIALDVSQGKLDELRRRCTRAGADIVETHLIESNKIIKRLKASADAVLLDVPCTGMGVLRRNPDKKWRVTNEEISRLNSIQAEILRDYSAMVKPGGRLVYATCSILPSENEERVQAFLQDQPRWELKRELKFAPGHHRYDGFYAALLQAPGPS